MPDPRVTEKRKLPDPVRYPADAADKETGVGANDRSSTSPPRWVAVVVIIIAAVLVLGFVVLHSTGTFGPGLHGGG